MAKGFGGLPGNLQGLMQQAQKMQQNLKAAQQTASELTAEASVAGGAVKATASGKNQILKIEIAKELIESGDVTLVQDSVLAAVNGALGKVQQQVQQEIEKATGGMNIPGMF